MSSNTYISHQPPTTIHNGTLSTWFLPLPSGGCVHVYSWQCSHLPFLFMTYSWAWHTSRTCCHHALCRGITIEHCLPWGYVDMYYNLLRRHLLLLLPFLLTLGLVASWSESTAWFQTTGILGSESSDGIIIIILLKGRWLPTCMEIGSLWQRIENDWLPACFDYIWDLYWKEQLDPEKNFQDLISTSLLSSLFNT